MTRERFIATAALALAGVLCSESWADKDLGDGVVVRQETGKPGRDDDALVIKLGNRPPTIIPNIDNARLDRTVRKVVDNGSLVIVPYGQYGNGDCVVMISIDRAGSRVTRVLDWRPRDCTAEIWKTSTEGDKVEVHFVTGRHGDVETLFRATFASDGAPAWKVSESRWYGGCNQPSIVLTVGLNWINTYGPNSRFDKDDREAYRAHLRAKPTSQRPADEKEIDDPQRYCDDGREPRK